LAIILVFSAGLATGLQKWFRTFAVNMKRRYQPLNMVMNGRYAVLYGKLSPKEQQDVRMMTARRDVGLTAGFPRSGLSSG
jgi:hypothetical protein